MEDWLTVDELDAARRSTERKVLGHQCQREARRVFEAECGAILRSRLAHIPMRPAKAELRPAIELAKREVN